MYQRSLRIALPSRDINVRKSGKLVKIFTKQVEHSRQRHTGAKNIEHGRTKPNREQTHTNIEEIMECIFSQFAPSSIKRV
ncbi:MAG: hypothetical protein JSV20_09625 [Candidatus Bathyarchaeota archaeon]|nr:MAG: hypothetical protein JSV20_09625 [Candidatus Bathyarchaeota archaeon]